MNYCYYINNILIKGIMMVDINRLQAQIKYDEICKCFDKHINENYINISDYINDLSLNRINEFDLSRQFVLYEGDVDDFTLEDSTYMLYYGRTKTKYYFFYISHILPSKWNNFNDWYMIYDLCDFSINNLRFEKNNNYFVVEFEEKKELFYKKRDLNFIDLFNSYRIKFYTNVLD